MKRRLFWKILFGVWAMFFAVAVGLSVWTQWQFYSQSGYRAQIFGAIEQYGRRHVLTASIALRYGGTPALNELLATWPEEERRPLTVRKATADEIAAVDLGVPSATRPVTAHEPPRPVPSQLTVLSPEGPYRLSYETQWLDTRYQMPFGRYFGRFLFTPELVVEAFASLLFSLALAWHLTRPLQRVRAGMDRLAGGDLSARLDARTRGRRDEIGDLARDFDRVAARLEELVNAREQLLHEVSHECRSPLARIRLAIDLARQDPAKGPASFARIDEESRRLDTMIGDLLTLARAESGVARMEGFVDVGALVLAVADDARFEAAPAGIAIHVSDNFAPAMDEPLPPVCGDVELLRRTLDNVLRNAVAVSNPGKAIHVTVHCDVAKGCYLIEVADEGPGVSAETLATMFEPFVRLDSGARAGFGLGLAIARRAIETLKGEITASNRSTGGLVVRIRLPFAEVETNGEARSRFASRQS